MTPKPTLTAEQMQRNFDQQDSFYLVAGSIVLLLIITLIAYIYYRVIKNALNADFLGKARWMRLVNLCLTVIIFRSVFNLVILWPLKLIIELSQVIVSKDYVNTKYAQGDGRGPGLFNQLYQYIYVHAQHYFNHIDIGVVNLSFAIVFLVFVSLLEVQIFWDKANNIYSLGHLSNTLKKSMSLSVVILIGLYFLFVAIVATTKISTSTYDPHISVTKLDSTLDKMMNQDDIKKTLATIDTGLNTSQVTRQLEVLDESFKKRKEKQSLVQDYSQFKDSVTKYFSFLGEYKTQVSFHNALVNNFMRNANLLENKINIKYADISHNLTNPQREKYMDQLSDYYASQVSYQNNAIINSADYLAAIKMTEQYKVAEIVGNIQAFNGWILSDPDKHFDFAKLKWQRPMLASTGDSGLPDKDAKLPVPEKSSQEWGVVGAISSWLTDTLSLNLAIIIGMIGFGIFGAGISSFIIKEVESQKDISSLESVISVLVRGFSAALIIYLFAKSGLALANNSNTDPNPYFLYFSCLTGAVFSDRIWEWARSFIDKNYQNFTTKNKNKVPENKVKGAIAGKTPVSKVP